VHTDLTLINKIANRYAQVEFEARYARLLLAMSMEQAKQVLGFPPLSSPSPEEIMKAYRSKAFENHPDRGGDPAKMVEVNVAKDILTGKSRPTNEPGRPQDKNYEWSRQKPPTGPDSVMEGQNFSKAWSSNTPPSGVEWKFVSIPEWYWEKSYYPGHRVWTLYGRTESKHIFLAIKERGESGGTIPTDMGQRTKVMEDWQVSWVDAPLSQNVAKIATKYIKLIGTQWADGATPKPAKKFVAWQWDRPTEEVIKKIPRSGGAALKDILVGCGLLNDEDPSVVGRKSVVEVYTKYSREKISRMKAEKKRMDNADSYEFFVRVNGKDCQLTDATVENLKKSFIPYVMNWEISEGRPFNLSRLRGSRGGFSLKFDAATAITHLTDCLTSEPSWLHLALEKAAEEYLPESKTSSLLSVASEMTLRQAAEVLGMSMYDLFRTIHA